MTTIVAKFGKFGYTHLPIEICASGDNFQAGYLRSLVILVDSIYINYILVLISYVFFSRDNCTASYVVKVHLVSALRVREGFNTGDHTLLLWQRRCDIRHRNLHNSQAALEEAMADAPTLESRRLRWGTKPGEWITVLPYTVNKTELGIQ